jgi:sodium/hydrogen antiporter
MSFIGWLALVGTMLLALALSSAWIRRAPISTAAIYLLAGCILGPWGLDLLRIDLVDASPWLVRFTEIALILSLFTGGLRLRLPLRHPAWGPAYRLAGLVMLASIGAVAAAAWLIFDVPPALALLMGAVLAPTDPVLAGAVTVGHAADHDRLRYALSGEAGLNDGAAFPFVVLALLLMGTEVMPKELAAWATHRLLWAVPAGLAIGFTLGRLLGRAAIALRAGGRDIAAPTDFLALALVALSYTAAEAAGAWGFLSVFAAGVGLRHAEVRTVKDEPHPDAPRSTSKVHPPAETLVSPHSVTEKEISQPAVAAGVLVAEAFSFGDTVERILEFLLVILVGVTLASHWDVRGMWLGILLSVAFRPLSTWLFLARSSLTTLQRGLVGWFGIRGIGSIYYLAYAISEGLQEGAARDLADITLSAVATSIVIHGLSVQPLMEWYERRGRRSRIATPRLS